MKRFLKLLAVVLCLAALPVSSVAAYGEHWIDSMPEPSGYAYSFAVVGDTQVICDESPEGFKAIYDWIGANIAAKKMKMVIGMGDITEHKTDMQEWNLAYDNISRLFGKVPLSLIRGNHDDAATFNNTFYELNDAVDGAYEEGNLVNTYQLLTVGQTHYLILALDYGPSNAVLDWANKVCKAHPGYNVIVTTHGYMDTTGTLLKKGTGANDGGMAYHGAENGGEEIWNRLVSKNKNIVMVLCGHVGENGVVKNVRTRSGMPPVAELLINPQNIDDQHKHTGMVAMLYFSADGKTVTVQNYSTIQKKFYGEQFTVSVATVAHTHKAADTTWYKDNASHWKTCPCGEVMEKAAHKYVSGKCVCGAVEGEVITTTTNAAPTTTTAAAAAASTTVEVIVQGSPISMGLIIGLIAGAVVLVAGIVVAIVLIAKKK